MKRKSKSIIKYKFPNLPGSDDVLSGEAEGSSEEKPASEENGEGVTDKTETDGSPLRC